MAITEEAGPRLRKDRVLSPTPVRPQDRDLQQTFRLLLATVWLMDAALQLQQFFFTPGKAGFSGMLQGTAAGNPSWIAHTITWNASVVDHHAVFTNSLFAGIQFLIAFGIAWRRTVKPALALSIVWSIGVWWFGESLGGILHGAATPLGGGPGAVLFYGLLAVLLWPSEGPNSPFVAARTIGAGAARVVWAVVWLLLALLAVVGQRSLVAVPARLRRRPSTMVGSQVGWPRSTNGLRRSCCTTAPGSPCCSPSCAWWWLRACTCIPGRPRSSWRLRS